MGFTIAKLKMPVFRKCRHNDEKSKENITKSENKSQSYHEKPQYQ